MTDLKSLENEAFKLVELATKAGADHCDVVVASGESLSVSVREGKIENSERSDGDGRYLRVFCGKRVASVSANQSNNLPALAERAVAMAKVSPEDIFQGLADKDRIFKADNMGSELAKLDLYDDFQPNAKELESRALDAEAAGLGVAGVSKSFGAGAAHSTNGFVLATSDGFTGSYMKSGFSISAMMVAGEGTGMERDYEFDTSVHIADLKDASEIGRLAGERTVKRTNPKQVKSGKLPIVFEPRISSSLLGTLAGAINGSSIARKTSFLCNRMNEKIANDTITIIDDPHIVRRSGSRLFDGEGVQTSMANLVGDGILNQWILDSATARELGLETNGRATRSGSGTSPSTTNCYIKAGSRSPDEMIGEIKNGLYVTETIGHGINMVTGDYSKGISGYWIENGEITHPVAEITVAGNLNEMFLNMTPASDLEFKYSTNAPTLLIEGMVVGGK